MDEFEQFWLAYPRKIGKGDARKSWQKTTKIRPPLSVILESLKNARRSEQWQRDDGRYIPHPATWLNQERWADEHEVNLADALEWYETSTGIEQMGASLGIFPKTFAAWPTFKEAVMRAVKVNPIARTA